MSDLVSLVRDPDELPSTTNGKHTIVGITCCDVPDDLDPRLIIFVLDRERKDAEGEAPDVRLPLGHRAPCSSSTRCRREHEGCSQAVANPISSSLLDI
jgi:hypothetical protein